jgi:hypothetical protein
MTAHWLGLPLTAALLAAACGGAAPPARSPGPPVPTPAPSTASPPSASPPSASPPSAQDCEAALRDGTALLSESKLAEAAAILEPAVARCGNGHGLHNALGLLRSSQHRIDDAASEFVAELKDPRTDPQVFANLHEIYGLLAQPRQLEIAGLGASADAPIKVPTIRFEYLWVGAFGCVGGQGKVKMQALIQGKTGPLDMLRYDCPDGKSHETYFDYSDDPDEKAMREELKKAK